MAITKVDFDGTASVENQKGALYSFLSTYASELFDTIESTVVNTLETVKCTVNIGSNYSALQFQYVNGYWRCGYVSDIHENTWNNTADYKFMHFIATSKGVVIQYDDSVNKFDVVIISKSYEGHTFIYMPISVSTTRTPKFADMVTGAVGTFPSWKPQSVIWNFTAESETTVLVPFVTQNSFSYSPYIFHVTYSPMGNSIHKMTLKDVEFYTNGSTALMD